VLSHEAMVGAPSATPSWIWPAAVIPGWTHALGCLIANGWLFGYVYCAEAEANATTTATEATKPELPEKAMEGAPSVRIDVQEEIVEKPRVKRKVPPRPAFEGVRIDVYPPETPSKL
jgi:hypothetical protein